MTTIRATPRNGDPAVTVDTADQSVAENIMLRLGYGCRDYALSFADADPAVPLDAPLSSDEIREQAGGDEYGHIAGVVAVGLPDLVDNDTEGVLDLLSERLTGSPLLMDIGYRVAGFERDTLFVEVNGDASEVLFEIRRGWRGRVS